MQRLALLFALCLPAVTCGGNPITPTPPVTSPPPVVTPNTAPVIRSLTAFDGRTEVGRDIEITADVTDAETPAGQLTYEWTANAGAFTGTGARVTWRLAAGLTATPVNVTITLTVIERYTEVVGSSSTPREHRVSSTAAPFRVHDSRAEVSKMTMTFLVDYFGNSAVGPDQCLVDFSNNCPGKQAEFQDIVRDRQNYQMVNGAQATIASVTFNGAMTTADVVAPCSFTSRSRTTGLVGSSRGDCLLTAIYEQNRWWLCSSSYVNVVPVSGAPHAIFGWDGRRR